MNIYDLITLGTMLYMTLRMLFLYDRDIKKSETKHSFWQWLVEKNELKRNGVKVKPEEVQSSSNATVQSTKLTFIEKVMKWFREWWAERKRRKSERIRNEAEWRKIHLEDQKRLDAIKDSEKAYKAGREKEPGWFVRKWRAFKGLFYAPPLTEEEIERRKTNLENKQKLDEIREKEESYEQRRKKEPGWFVKKRRAFKRLFHNPPLTEQEEKEKERKKQARKAKIEKEGGLLWRFMNWVKTGFRNIFKKGKKKEPDSFSRSPDYIDFEDVRNESKDDKKKNLAVTLFVPRPGGNNPPNNGGNGANTTGDTNGSDDHWLKRWFSIDTDSRKAMRFLTVVDIIGFVFPLFFILLAWASSNINGIVPLGGDPVNLWVLGMIVWVLLALKMSWTTVKPDEIGVIYFFGYPLLTVKAGPYLVFPLIFDIIVESNANIMFLVTARPKEEIPEKEKKKYARVIFLDKEEITTTTPMSANWGMEKPENWDDTKDGVWKADFTQKEREQIEGNPKAKPPTSADPYHMSATTKPSFVVNFIKINYILYIKNLKGKTSEEREEELGRQTSYIASGFVNSEWKGRTLAMLMKLQTKKLLDDSLRKEIDELFKGYQSKHKGSLGLECIDARVISLGISDEIHKAANAAMVEKFNVTRMKLQGEGKKKEMFEIALGEEEMFFRKGLGNARGLWELFEMAKDEGVDKIRLLEIQTQLEAFEKGKHTYVTNLLGQGFSMDDAIKKGFEKLKTELLNLIKTQKGGKAA